ncbi:hypothetical protein [Natroniella sp. ANB-PHB2]|uniref:hypothetical protein n=1 Tax=Natroniella sp. ANB-PHB2 TaxID=3384444 RepID=UPI0038D46A4D
MKRLNLASFGIAKDGPNMIIRLARHVSSLEEVILKQQKKIELLESELEVDSELELMKEKAEELGIDFPHNIKKETLAQKIEEKLKEDDTGGE